MKEKINYFFKWIFYNFLNYLPCFIIFILLSIQSFSIFAISSRSSWFDIAAQILILPPWIIVLMIYAAKKNKYHKIGFNEPQVEIILQTINATETTAKDVIKDYKSFINYEKREDSVVAKYFYNNDAYTKSKYEFLTSQCSLSSFCIKKELIAQCKLFIFTYKYSFSEIIKFASMLFGKEIYKWLYRCGSINSKFSYNDFEEILSEYIIFSVLNRKNTSYESFLCFAIDICDYKEEKEMLQLFLKLIESDDNISDELKHKKPNGYNYELYIREIGYL